MTVSFDPAKDAINRAKHGLSLAEAERGDWTAAFIALDDRMLTCQSPAGFTSLSIPNGMA
jgi:uncharacterized DUF497 family protein